MFRGLFLQCWNREVMSVLFGVCVVLMISLPDTEGCTSNRKSAVTLTNNEGSLDPGILTGNAVCQWTITAPEGKVVRIWSFNGFILRPGDSIRIHDGANDSSRLVASFNHADPLLAKIDGVYFISSGRSLWVEIKTGYSRKLHNLMVYYRVQENPGCSMNMNLKAPKYSLEKDFTSPAYWPSNYQSDLTCGWYIEAPENYNVRVTISLSRMQRSEYSIQVFDKDGSDLSPLTLASFNTIISKYRSIYIRIKSDSPVYLEGSSTPGIEVNYTATKTACIWNNTLQAQTEIQNTIFMPLWSIYYRGQKSCGWYIKASKNQAITLEMKTSREFEGTTTYTNDTLWVYNAEGSDLKLIRRFNFPAFRPTFQYTTPATQLIYILLESENQPSDIIDLRLSSIGYKASLSGSASSTIKIVLGCLGGVGAIILCVVIAITGYKHLKSRRNQTNWQQMS